MSQFHYFAGPDGQQLAVPIGKQAKPRLSVAQLAELNARVKNCQKAKAAGLPCTEFPTEEIPQSKPAGLLIPQPPPLDLKPRHKRALVTVAVGDEARAMLRVSGPYMRAYAHRLDADFVVLDWPGHPDWPMSAKFAIARTLDWYERIAYVDADVLLRPGCVDLFDACRPDEMGIVDELAWHRAQPKFGRERGYNSFRQAMGFARVPVPWMANCGVMVVPASHRDLLLPPTRPIKPAHCAEQDHTGAMLLDSGLPYRLLDRRCNWQNWTDPGFRSAPADAILHWSGAGQGRRSRVEDMARWAKRFPLFDPGIPADRDLAIDPTHCRWLFDLLMTGRFRRVLEIGCHRGYSTQAYLAACHHGGVREVHLCEPNVLPELHAMINGKAPYLHRCRSVDLLRDYRRPFDFVFVDGDHTLENVREEARLLLDAGVRCVLAHDTQCAERFPNCDGPAELVRMFREAGYHCYEDTAVRPGEATDRGMFLACLVAADFAELQHTFPDLPLA